MTMVKLIIMDIDGVIVGHKIGVNFPYPSPKVLATLKEIRQRGIPVVLCTGKYYQAVKPTIQKAELYNPHITDSGSVIFDPTSEEVIRSFNIENNLATKIINTALRNNIYLEMYSENDYFIQKGTGGDILPRRTPILLNRQPKIARDLAKEAEKHQIIKLLTIDKNIEERKRTEKILSQFKGQVNIIWTMHPSTRPWEYCLLTSTEASKANATKAVAEQLGISLENTLGMGDTLGDWEFMKLCSYAATMEEGPKQLKKLVESKGKGKYFIAPSVDKDGILKALDYFFS